MRLPASMTLRCRPGSVGETRVSVVLKFVAPVPATECADAGPAPAMRIAAAITTVTMMRRMRIILALAGSGHWVTLGGGQRVARASAHFCSIPAEINVGEDVMVNIGVAAEDKPVDGRRHRHSRAGSS